MSVVGLAMDWVEAIADAIDDPELRPAGFAEPHYPVSPQVTVSRDRGLYVYHLADDQLGQGSSFGNARAWAETKGTGDMLGLYSIDVGARVLGGLSLTYLLPFSDLSDGALTRQTAGPVGRHDRYSRVMPTARGAIHLHPAYQQREFVIGDGLHILETFFLPRTGMDDPAAAHTVVALRNRTPHPLRIIVVASLDLRGATSHDIVARFDDERATLVAFNASQPDWVRVFGASMAPAHYCATTDEERAYSPDGPLSDRTAESGDLTGALQFDLLLLPRQRYKLRLTAAFSPQGSRAALHAYDALRHHHHALRDTIAHYAAILETATLEVPDALLSQAIQWAKTCLLRPVSRYAMGDGVTNDPGRSTRLVGRDTAWYVHGCDYVMPNVSCSLLQAFARSQRADGLIMEYVDGRTGETEDHGFNINDNTPLFVMAVAHHARVSGHTACMQTLYEPARRAAEAVLAARDERGLVRCSAMGSGIAGICGWRNIMQHERIGGVVTEVNAESYAALRAMADLAGWRGCDADARRFRDAAERLRAAINGCLLDPHTGLYVRNIDPDGRTFTQATIDLVFPLMLGVAEPDVARRIIARLALPDFMTPGGIRAVPRIMTSAPISAAVRGISTSGSPTCTRVSSLRWT